MCYSVCGSVCVAVCTTACAAACVVVCVLQCVLRVRYSVCAGQSNTYITIALGIWPTNGPTRVSHFACASGWSPIEKKKEKEKNIDQQDAYQ